MAHLGADQQQGASHMRLAKRQSSNASENGQANGNGNGNGNAAASDSSVDVSAARNGETTLDAQASLTATSDARAVNAPDSSSSSAVTPDTSASSVATTPTSSSSSVPVTTSETPTTSSAPSTSSTSSSVSTTSSTTESTSTTMARLSTTSSRSASTATETETTDAPRSTSTVIVAPSSASSSSSSSSTALSSAAANSSGGSSDGTPSTGVIVGIVAGALFAVVVLSALIGYFFRKKFSRRRDDDDFNDDDVAPFDKDEFKRESVMLDDSLFPSASSPHDYSAYGAAAAGGGLARQNTYGHPILDHYGAQQQQNMYPPVCAPGQIYGAAPVDPYDHAYGGAAPRANNFAHHDPAANMELYGAYPAAQPQQQANLSRAPSDSSAYSSSSAQHHAAAAAAGHAGGWSRPLSEVRESDEYSSRHQQAYDQQGQGYATESHPYATAGPEAYDHRTGTPVHANPQQYFAGGMDVDQQHQQQFHHLQQQHGAHPTIAVRNPDEEDYGGHAR